MGYFFLAVSGLKLADWRGFAHAYAMYDVLAMRSKFYSYLYPLLELALGISYLYFGHVKLTALVTLGLMAISSIGVTRNLLSKNKVQCACLGTLIKIPLTKFTLFEDIAMAIMALIILI